MTGPTIGFRYSPGKMTLVSKLAILNWTKVQRGTAPWNATKIGTASELWLFLPNPPILNLADSTTANPRF